MTDKGDERRGRLRTLTQAALNADMQLARRRLLAECASDGFVQGVPDAADSPDVGNHVLLSNYRR